MNEILELKGKLEKVLNLVINGIPSIQIDTLNTAVDISSFKPCYKWNTFNTLKDDLYDRANWMF